MWRSLKFSTSFTKTFSPDITSDSTTSVTASYHRDSPSDGISSLQITFPIYIMEEVPTIFPTSNTSDSPSAELSRFPFIFLSELPLYDLILPITYVPNDAPSEYLSSLTTSFLHSKSYE